MMSSWFEANHKVRLDLALSDTLISANPIIESAFFEDMNKA